MIQLYFTNLSRRSQFTPIYFFGSASTQCDKYPNINLDVQNCEWYLPFHIHLCTFEYFVGLRVPTRVKKMVENLRKKLKIIHIIASQEPFIKGFCRRFANELSFLSTDAAVKKIKFLLRYCTLPTLNRLYKNNLLTREMTLFIGRCLMKRKQQNRRLVSGLMFEYNCYRGKYSKMCFLSFKISRKN